MPSFRELWARGGGKKGDDLRGIGSSSSTKKEGRIAEEEKRTGSSNILSPVCREGMKGGKRKAR